MKKEEEIIFEIGDKVYCCMFGWGLVKKINYNEVYPIVVQFPSKVSSYTNDGKYWEHAQITLSFTKYKLEGFTQERPEVLPNKGDIVWVRDDEGDEWLISHFVEKQGRYYGTTDGDPFSGIVETLSKYLKTENPYKNGPRN